MAPGLDAASDFPHAALRQRLVGVEATQRRLRLDPGRFELSDHTPMLAPELFHMCQPDDGIKLTGWGSICPPSVWGL
jgi:hypothetical protein